MAEKAQTEKLNASLQSERDKLLRSSREDARKIIAKAREEATELISQIKEILSRDVVSDRDLFVARDIAKQIAKIDIPENDDEDEEFIFTGDKVDFDKLRAGDVVFSMKMGVQVTVIEIRSKTRVRVRSGSITTEVPSDDLYYSVSEKNSRVTRSARHSAEPKTKINTRSVSNELNVIGQTVSEAIANVDEFIDNAVLAGLKQAWVIHGNGTGKLRAGLHAHFRKHPSVADFRLGTYGEGESGVTVLTLK